MSLLTPDLTPTAERKPYIHDYWPLSFSNRGKYLPIWGDSLHEMFGYSRADITVFSLPFASRFNIFFQWDNERLQYVVIHT